LAEEVVVSEEKPEELTAVTAQIAAVGASETVLLEIEAKAPSLPIIEEVEEVFKIISVENPKVTMEPLEPRKVMLPLQPSSLKLTRAARDNFRGFVEKLQNYPKSTILVKGYWIQNQIRLKILNFQRLEH